MQECINEKLGKIGEGRRLLLMANTEVSRKTTCHRRAYQLTDMGGITLARVPGIQTG
jgi:hypothetical protein